MSETIQPSSKNSKLDSGCWTTLSAEEKPLSSLNLTAVQVIYFDELTHISNEELFWTEIRQRLTDSAGSDQPGQFTRGTLRRLYVRELGIISTATRSMLMRTDSRGMRSTVFSYPSRRGFVRYHVLSGLSSTMGLVNTFVGEPMPSGELNGYPTTYSIDGVTHWNSTTMMSVESLLKDTRQLQDIVSATGKSTLADTYSKTRTTLRGWNAQSPSISRIEFLEREQREFLTQKNDWRHNRDRVHGIKSGYLPKGTGFDG